MRPGCGRGSCTERRWRSFPGFTAASHCSRAASARSSCCVCRRRRIPRGRRWRFLSIPAVSAIGWMGFFVAIYGVADPSAPYGTGRDFSIAFIPGGLTGLLFDQRFGLLANAPVLAVGVAGLVMMLRLPKASEPLLSPGLADRRLAIELLFVMVPYLLTATSYAMWWAGSSAPARFASPAVLDPRDSLRRCVAVDPEPRDACHRSRVARADGISVVGAGGRRRRATRLQLARVDGAVVGLGVEADLARRGDAGVVQGPRGRVRRRRRRVGGRPCAGVVVRATNRGRREIP